MQNMGCHSAQSILSAYQSIKNTSPSNGNLSIGKSVEAKLPAQGPVKQPFRSPTGKFSCDSPGINKNLVGTARSFRDFYILSSLLYCLCR